MRAASVLLLAMLAAGCGSAPEPEPAPPPVASPPPAFQAPQRVPNDPDNFGKVVDDAIKRREVLEEIDEIRGEDQP